MSGPYVEGPPDRMELGRSERMAAMPTEDDLARRVALRLEPTSTYVDVEQDVVDGLLSDVIDAVRAELQR